MINCDCTTLRVQWGHEAMSHYVLYEYKANLAERCGLCIFLCIYVFFTMLLLTSSTNAYVRSFKAFADVDRRLCVDIYKTYGLF